MSQENVEIVRKQIEAIDRRDRAAWLAPRPPLRSHPIGDVAGYSIVITFREGRIVRDEWFADRADALEAAGLRD